MNHLKKRFCAIVAMMIIISIFNSSFVFASTLTLQQQIQNAANGDVITLSENYNEAITIAAGKEITLNLNGFSLTSTGSAVITNNGKLTISDSVGTGSISKASAANTNLYGIANYGTLAMSGGTINVSVSGTGAVYGVYNYANSSFSMTGGTILASTTGTNYSAGIWNAATATITQITNGNISASINNSVNTANALGISNESGATINSISGGKIYAETNNAGIAYGLRNRGTLQTLSGGSITAVTTGTQYAYGLLNDTAGTITTISGSVLTATINNKNNANNALALNNLGIVTSITGGAFIAQISGAGSAYGIRSDGTISSVSGGAYKGNTSANAIYQRAGTITYASGYTLSNISSLGFRYAMQTGSYYVQLCDEKESWMATYVYNSSYILINTIGANVENSYTVYRWRNDQNTETVVCNSNDFGSLKTNATLYVKKYETNKYCFLGSSVTYGYTTGGVSFVDNLANDNNWICYKKAVSGTTLANINSSSYVERMKNEINIYAPMDAFICQLSTNDATLNEPMGQVIASKNLSDFNTATTIGAMEYIICYASETWKCPVVFFTNPYFNNANYELLIDALYQLQSKWGIGIIDFYYNKYMNSLPSATLSSYMSDSIHPNAQGYQWIAGVMKDNLNALPAAVSVIGQINNLPASVTLNDKDAVTTARSNYNALADSQKGLISAELLSKLTKSEIAITQQNISSLVTSWQYTPSDKWTENSGTNLTGNGFDATWMNNNAITEIGSTSTYKVKFDASATSVDNSKTEWKYGVFPWFINKQNYVCAWVDVTASGFKAVSINGAINNTEIGWTSLALPSNFDITQNHSVSITVSSSTITISVDGSNIGSKTISGMTNFNGVKVGFNVFNCVTTFNNIAVNNDYGWKLSDSTTYTVNGNGNVTGNTQNAGWLTANAFQANTFDDYVVSTDITLGQRYVSECKYGIYPWYKDANNRVVFWIDWWEGGSPSITATGRLNGEIIGSVWRSAALPSGIDLYTTHNFAIKKAGSRFMAYIDNTLVLDTTFDGVSGSGDIGLNSYKAKVNYANISVTGFAGWEHNTVEKWLNKSGNIIVGNGIGAGWLAGNALYTGSDLITYDVSVNLKMLSFSGHERKFGMYPWYKDANNWVCVWIDQWVGDIAKLTFIGKINGTDINPYFRVVALPSNLSLSDEHLLTVSKIENRFVLKVDGVQYNDITLDGVSGTGYVGLNAFGAKVQYRNLTTVDANDPAQTSSITSFSVATATSEQYTMWSGISLPANITVKYNNGTQTAQIPVTWTVPDYFNTSIYNVMGSYTAAGTLDQTALTAAGLNNSANLIPEFKLSIVPDVTAPVVTGVQNGHTYYLKNGRPTISFNEGNGALNSVSMASGFTVESKTESYILQVTDLSGNTTDASFNFIVKGDVNGDGSIGLEDLVAIKRDLLKTTSLTGVYATAGDIFEKGHISISDLIAVKKSILGLTMLN